MHLSDNSLLTSPCSALPMELTHGTLPEIYLTDYGPRFLKEYVNTYVKEVVQAEALVRSLRTFANFLILAAENSGQITNYSSFASLGKHFEPWFICQIIAHNSYQGKGWQIHYYRDDKKNEVDLIIDTGKNCVAIEIKYTQHFKNDFTKGLKAFQEVCLKPVKPF